MTMLTAVDWSLLAVLGLSMLLGLWRGLVILLAVTVVVGMTPMRESDAWQHAQGAQWLQQFLHVLKPVLPADFGKYLP